MGTPPWKSHILCPETHPKPSFIVCCYDVFKYFALCACAAAWKLTRFHEDGRRAISFLQYLLNKTLFLVSLGFWRWNYYVLTINIDTESECTKQDHWMSTMKFLPECDCCLYGEMPWKVVLIAALEILIMPGCKNPLLQLLYHTWM